jgi:hypothetical protein
VAEDVTFYVHRERGGYQYLSLAVIVLHFAVPFLILLSRRTKRNARALRALAIGLLFVRLVEIFWCLAPNFYGHDLHVHWMDFAAPMGIGGLWLAYFLRRLDRSSFSMAAIPSPRVEPHGGGAAPKPRAA